MARCGLSGTEAAALLARYGPNAIAVERPSRLTILAHGEWTTLPGDVWRVGRLVGAAVSLSVLTALTVFGTVILTAHLWRLDVDHLRSAVFFGLVAMAQIAVFVVRARSSLFGLPRRAGCSGRRHLRLWPHRS